MTGRRNGAKRKVIAALSQGVMTQRELRERTGLQRRTIDNALQKLKRLGVAKCGWALLG